MFPHRKSTQDVASPRITAVLVGRPDESWTGIRVKLLTVPTEVVVCHREGGGYDRFRRYGERVSLDPTVLVYEWEASVARDNGIFLR
jgi:hypothetical protein